MDCLPAYTGSAIFTALVILDLINQNWTALPGHILFGIFVVLLLIYICQSRGPALGWILLSIPLVFILLGLLLGAMKKPVVSAPVTKGPTSVNTDICECPCCTVNPCKCRKPCPKPTPPGPKRACIKPTLQS
jgi:hypothetical protein